MKKLLIIMLSISVALVAFFAIGVQFAIQQGMLSRSDLTFLADLGRRDGPAAVVSTIKAGIVGVDPTTGSDPSYGRQHVTGRGHAPWVMRGNLDGRPRIIKFALKPGIWAAYDTQRQSLYQVWRGGVLFEGAAYDYRHGPQPISEGAWFVRDTAGARWFLQVDEQEIPATVTYLGHEYSQSRQTAAMRFIVHAGELTVELTEQPDIAERDGAEYFTRSFFTTSAPPGPIAGFYDGNGTRHLASGVLQLRLDKATPMQALEPANFPRGANEDERRQGESVIANSDCMGCHASHHRVTGPAWSEISGKFRARLQHEVVDALAESVLQGSVGTWGVVPMPAHPDLSEEEAKAAVTYILSTGEPDSSANPPLDASGRPYPATRDYDVLDRLDSLHPSFELANLAPAGFEPKVGGMAFREDGKLAVVSWDLDGAAYLLDLQAPPEHRVKRIAEGLHEPLGLTYVDGRLFVLQKQELTELIDTDGDDVIDQYRAVSYDWPSSSNFHSFAFGLLHRDDHFYFLLSICVLPGGASCPEQLPTQGKLLRADMDGKVEIYASGFRTPNGIGTGADGEIYVADNQGDWLPASKLLRIQQGGFYGSRAVADEGVMEAAEIAPVVWLPQDEVGNSPTQPMPLTEGPYSGQMLHGDVYNGGLKRVFIEEVKGRPQGAAFHFSAGFVGGVNRLLRGPDGAIYLGEVGNPPNWGEYGKAWHGLERMTWVGNEAFEILAVRAQHDGFVLELTQPLAPDIDLSPSDLLVKQWFYRPDEQYGGPKYDDTTLTAARLEVAADRRSIRARIPGLQAGYVVYLRLHDRLRSTQGQALWTAEAWYTLNAIPDGPATAGARPAEQGWRALFDGTTLEGWRNYGGAADQVKKWHAENGMLVLKQPRIFPMRDMIAGVLFGAGSGDLIYYREKFRNFELSLEWMISENGNSGIFYLVRDEGENSPWITGIEMQVLHNEGHKDGQIETHRAGDLYDLLAARPETVRPPGQWNAVRIRVQDNHIEHWLNGVRVISIERGSEEWNALVAASKFAERPGYGESDEGYIVLQDHGDPVWYRNIRVRTLTSSAPAPPPR